jgi:NAD(P)H-dependent FMN reductase
MHEIVTISGSPFPSSRCSSILDYAKGLITKQELIVASFAVRDLSLQDLVYCNFDSSKLKKLQLVIKQAQAGFIKTTRDAGNSETSVLRGKRHGGLESACSFFLN